MNLKEESMWEEKKREQKILTLISVDLLSQEEIIFVLLQTERYSSSVDPAHMQCSSI